MRRAVLLTGIAAGLAGGIDWALDELDRLGPGASGWDGLAAWYDAAVVGELVAGGGLAVAVVVASWLLVATGLQLLAELVPGAALRGLADGVAPAILRSVGRTVADVTLGAAVLAAPLATAAEVLPPPTSLVEDQPGTATLRPLDPAPPALDRPAAPPAPEPEVAPAAPAPSPATVVVGPGDSFWSLAEALVSERLGRPATDAEVDGTWRGLIAANADRLVVPGNPDLIYPGQVFVVPGVGPPPSTVRLAETL